MSPTVWKIFKGSRRIFPTENIMNISTDITVIKAAILECELISCNFYPFPIFVLTVGVRWTSVSWSEEASWTSPSSTSFFVSLSAPLRSVKIQFSETLRKILPFLQNLLSILPTSLKRQRGKSDRWHSQCEASWGRVRAGIILPGSNAQNTPSSP